jgi:hypothetical protein
VSYSANAECLDVEPRDATNAVAPAWVKRQIARGVKRPVIYTSVSNARVLLNTLAQEGIGRDDIRLWTAHYTGKAHRCSPACGFSFNTTADATQWTDKSLGRNLDESLCDDRFFGAAEKVQFTNNERRTIRLIETLRERPATAARRAAIRACEATLLVYRAKLRVAAAVSGWDRDDRRARYHAILVVYKGGRVDL